MAKFLAWSFSRLKSFEECRKQFYHGNIPAKGHPDRLPFVETPEMLEGRRVHTALDKRISSGTPLPTDLAHLEPMCLAILAAPGQNFTEMKLTIDRAFESCGSMDWDRAWLRVIVDLLKIHGDHAWLADYKTGKLRLEEDQLKLFAAIAFLLFPEVNRVTTSYVWLRDYESPRGFLSNKDFTREQAPELWAEFLPRVERMQIAFEANDWPADPKDSSACKFCNVNKAGKCPVALAPPWSPR